MRLAAPHRQLDMDTNNISFMARVLVDTGFSEAAVRRSLTLGFPGADVDAAYADAVDRSRIISADVALVAELAQSRYGIATRSTRSAVPALR